MKKILTFCLVVLTAVTTAKAQFEIGGIVGGLNGASAKYWFNDKMAIQADLAVGLTQGAFNGGSMGIWDFTVMPNFLYHFDVASGLKVYTGGGLNFGMCSGVAYYYGYNNGVAGKFGINANAGLAYEIPSAPIVLAFDFRPGYGLMFTGGNNASYFDWKLAFAVRYRL